jgi:hypothetical protein
MSPELQAFYNAYATWLNDGAPETRGANGALLSMFARNIGLCTNLVLYCARSGVKQEYRGPMEAELFDQLGRESYPFGGSVLYNEEARGGTSYLNAQRRAWVHKHSEVPVKGEA